MQFVAFFIFHNGKTQMQVKNDLRCLRQTIFYNVKKGTMLKKQTKIDFLLRLRQTSIEVEKSHYLLKSLLYVQYSVSDQW